MEKWFRPTQIANAIKAFAEFSHPDNRYFAAEVNAEPMVISDLTSDLEEILSLIPQVFVGATDFFEGVRTAMGFLDNVSGPKALVLFTDGQHNASTLRSGALERFIGSRDVELYGFFPRPGPYDGISPALARFSSEPFLRLIQMSGGMFPSVPDSADDAMVPFARSMADIFRHRFEVQCLVDEQNSGWKSVKAEAFGPRTLGKLQVVTRSRLLLPQYAN